MPLTPAAALTTWQFAPFVSALLGLLGACYLVAVWRVRIRVRVRVRGRPWPVVRTVAFLGGLAVIAVATQGSPGVYTTPCSARTWSCRAALIRTPT